MTKDKREVVFKRLKSFDELTDLERVGACEPTVDMIALATGMSPQNVRNNLGRLHGEERAYIVAWTRYRAPVWVKGKGCNVPKPTPVTREEALFIKRERSRISRKEGSIRVDGRKQTDDTIERARRAPRQWHSWLGAGREGES